MRVQRSGLRQRANVVPTSSPARALDDDGITQTGRSGTASPKLLLARIRSLSGEAIGRPREIQSWRARRLRPFWKLAADIMSGPRSVQDTLSFFPQSPYPIHAFHDGFLGAPDRSQGVMDRFDAHPQQTCDPVLAQIAEREVGLPTAASIDWVDRGLKLETPNPTR